MKKSPRGFTLVEIMIVVLVIGILMAIAVPQWITARERSQLNSCIANLKEIEFAKESWAMQYRKGATDSPTQSDLFTDATHGFLKSWPECPASGVYTIGDMQTLPTCTITGHVLP